MIHIRDFNGQEKRNVKLLVNRQVEYATLHITKTESTLKSKMYVNVTILRV